MTPSLEKFQQEALASKQAQEKLADEKARARTPARTDERGSWRAPKFRESRVAFGDIKGAKVLAAQVAGMDREQLRTMVDSLRVKWKTAVVILEFFTGFKTLLSWSASPKT